MTDRKDEFTENDIDNAVELIRKNHPQLFNLLIQSEIQNRPEWREGGRPLILALKQEGFKFSAGSIVKFAAKFRGMILKKYTKQ